MGCRSQRGTLCRRSPAGLLCETASHRIVPRLRPQKHRWLNQCHGLAPARTPPMFGAKMTPSKYLLQAPEQHPHISSLRSGPSSIHTGPPVLLTPLISIGSVTEPVAPIRHVRHAQKGSPILASASLLISSETRGLRVLLSLRRPQNPPLWCVLQRKRGDSARYFPGRRKLRDVHKGTIILGSNLRGDEKLRFTAWHCDISIPMVWVIFPVCHLILHVMMFLFPLRL